MREEIFTSDWRSMTIRELKIECIRLGKHLKDVWLEAKGEGDMSYSTFTKACSGLSPFPVWWDEKVDEILARWRRNAEHN